MGKLPAKTAAKAAGKSPPKTEQPALIATGGVINPLPGQEAPAQLRVAPPAVAPDGHGAASKDTPGLGGPMALPGLADVEEHAAICYYGKEGSTKTTSALSMANRGKVLLVNAEAGAKPTALRRRGIDIGNIRVWPDPAKGEELTFDGLEQLFYTIKADLMRDPDAWYGGVWDSLTEIAYKLLTKQREYGKVKAEKQGKERERFFTDISDYGVMSSQISELIRKFRDLPMHFVICALERRDVDNDTGKVKYGPAVNPALSTEIPGFVDIMIHCEAVEDEDAPEGVEVRGWSRVHGPYRAKDRFGVLPKVIPNPTFERVWDYVTGALDSDSDTDLQAVKRRAAIKRGDLPADGGEPTGDEVTELQTA